MKKILLFLFVLSLSVLPSLAENPSATCSGSGSNDYVVAEITRNGHFVELDGYGNFYNSKVCVTVEYKTATGSIQKTTVWLKIESGSASYIYSQDPLKLPDGSKMISITVSNPKCE